MPGREITVARADELEDGRSVKFTFAVAGEHREGFVIRHEGRFYAYRNECRHIPMTMDWVENRFLSTDGCHIQCATHGALYEIDTGECVAGPPAGQSLHRLEVCIVDGEIIVTVPD